MTSYTSTYGLPYPDGSNLVMEGDDAMQALAEALDDRLASSAVAHIERATNGSAITAAPVTINHVGATTYMAGFNYSAGVLTYLGPLRLFIATTQVEIENGNPAGATGIESSVQLVQSGVSVEGSYDRVTATAATLERRNVTHRISLPVQLNTGDTLAVTAACTPNGTAGLTSLRVYPIGPSTS